MQRLFYQDRLQTLQPAIGARSLTGDLLFLSRVVLTALGSELCASTLLGVRALASPDLLVEIDLVAAKMPDAPSL